MLRAVHAGGVSAFRLRLDRRGCAGAADVPRSRDPFHAPVKARGAIREAWARHGVRDFVLDSAEELAKILHETAATDVTGELGLIVRLALPKGSAVLDLSGKFGAAPALAAALLRAARPHAARLGLSFHVGSQCLDPLAWRAALALVGDGDPRRGRGDRHRSMSAAGFAVPYPEVEPPPLGAYLAEIETGFERLGLPDARLWAEPGRALVAGGGIGGRTGAAPPWRRVVRQRRRLWRAGRCRSTRLPLSGAAGTAGRTGAIGSVRRLLAVRARPVTVPIRCAGRSICRPTPAEGDWIEIGQLGAYGGCLRTAFNGFDRARLVEVRDDAMVQPEPLPLAA